VIILSILVPSDITHV